ncbi:MAG: 4-hydroxy-tetrahydrodipicolinate synthase [uncultured Thermoleophilia bacterium]|uniref:4-hydroxy-tetrahydrodipicolinate synthase n=1 Tax=uncultured Thermoleophilia bacterium TaxID=1497501 RepID=A0A6J4UQF3_9ACTN|nr:MAG: 4-hydroxy-tetrahydrodipicolinate synthase [uncultured Thermoleophilia bacterium]
MQAPFGRIVTAMVTPFRPDGSLDVEVARDVARHLVEHGSEGLVVAGTTGESPTLADAEKLALLEAVVDAVGSRVSVLCGTGTNDTAHSVQLTRAAVAAGADAVLAVTPYYSKPPAEGIYRHFRAIAEAAGDRPVVLYNIPSRVVVNLPPALLLRLAGIDNVVAVKQAHDDLDELDALVADGRLAVYAGNDQPLRTFVEHGAVGGICVASHVAGDDMLALVEAVENGDAARAAELDALLHELYPALYATTSPIPVKAAMELMGFAVGDPRLPLVAATEAERSAIRDALAARGLPAAA